jgi:acyl-coenzyme A thioesterase PaaI-like protein
MNPLSHRDLCFICGKDNPAGIHLHYSEQEDGSVLARFTGQDHHQGYPNRMHGGIITAILDETIGRAIMARGAPQPWDVTREIRVRFRQPAPLDVELIAVGRITSEDECTFEGRGELRLADGTVAAEAHATYRKLDARPSATFDLRHGKRPVRAE